MAVSLGGLQNYINPSNRGVQLGNYNLPGGKSKATSYTYSKTTNVVVNPRNNTVTVNGQGYSVAPSNVNTFIANIRKYAGIGNVNVVSGVGASVGTPSGTSAAIIEEPPKVTAPTEAVKQARSDAMNKQIATGGLRITPAIASVFGGTVGGRSVRLPGTPQTFQEAQDAMGQLSVDYAIVNPLKKPTGTSSSWLSRQKSQEAQANKIKADLDRIQKARDRLATTIEITASDMGLSASESATLADFTNRYAIKDNAGNVTGWRTGTMTYAVGKTINRLTSKANTMSNRVDVLAKSLNSVDALLGNKTDNYNAIVSRLNQSAQNAGLAQVYEYIEQPGVRYSVQVQGALQNAKQNIVPATLEQQPKSILSARNPLAFGSLLTPKLASPAGVHKLAQSASGLIYDFASFTVDIPFIGLKMMYASLGQNARGELRTMRSLIANAADIHWQSVNRRNKARFLGKVKTPYLDLDKQTTTIGKTIRGVNVETLRKTRDTAKAVGGSLAEIYVISSYGLPAMAVYAAASDSPDDLALALAGGGLFGFGSKVLGGGSTLVKGFLGKVGGQDIYAYAVRTFAGKIVPVAMGAMAAGGVAEVGGLGYAGRPTEAKAASRELAASFGAFGYGARIGEALGNVSGDSLNIAYAVATKDYYKPWQIDPVEKYSFGKYSEIMNPKTPPRLREESIKTLLSMKVTPKDPMLIKQPVRNMFELRSTQWLRNNSESAAKKGSRNLFDQATKPIYYPPNKDFDIAILDGTAAQKAKSYNDFVFGGTGKVKYVKAEFGDLYRVYGKGGSADFVNQKVPTILTGQGVRQVEANQEVAWRWLGQVQPKIAVHRRKDLPKLEKVLKAYEGTTGISKKAVINKDAYYLATMSGLPIKTKTLLPLLESEENLIYLAKEFGVSRNRIKTILDNSELSFGKTRIPGRMGLYDSQKKLITIYPKNVPSERLVIESTVHEFVHELQHNLGKVRTYKIDTIFWDLMGRIDEFEERLGIFNKKQLAQAIKEYNYLSSPIEIQARGLQGKLKDYLKLNEINPTYYEDIGYHTGQTLPYIKKGTFEGKILTPSDWDKITTMDKYPLTFFGQNEMINFFRKGSPDVLRIKNIPLLFSKGLPKEFQTPAKTREGAIKQTKAYLEYGMKNQGKFMPSPYTITSRSFKGTITGTPEREWVIFGKINNLKYTGFSFDPFANVTEGKFLRIITNYPKQEMSLLRRSSRNLKEIYIDSKMKFDKKLEDAIRNKASTLEIANWKDKIKELPQKLEKAVKNQEGKMNPIDKAYREKYNELTDKVVRLKVELAEASSIEHRAKVFNELRATSVKYQQLNYNYKRDALNYQRTGTYPTRPIEPYRQVPTRQPPYYVPEETAYRETPERITPYRPETGTPYRETPTRYPPYVPVRYAPYTPTRRPPYTPERYPPYEPPPRPPERPPYYPERKAFLDTVNYAYKKGFAYNVFVRINKRDVKVNKVPLTVASALNLGHSKVYNKALRSFFIVRIQGRPVKMQGLPAFQPEHYRLPYGRSALNRMSLVEKNKYAIDTEGERQEITLKGLRSLKRRRAA